jgi:hypothetical protein
MNINLTPRMILRKLSLFVLFLFLANIISIMFKLYLGHGRVYGFIPLFDLDKEANIPTFFSALVLIFCAFLLWMIAKHHKTAGSPYVLWMGLAVIFTFLSVDEISALHERLIGPIREALNTSGLFYYAWIIPYGFALIVFVAIYFRFLIRLPRQIRNLFILSGAIFVTGAIGFEMLGGWHAESNGMDNTLYCLFYTCEETLEMMGSVTFIYALLSYIKNQFNSFTIKIKE